MARKKLKIKLPKFGKALNSNRNYDEIEFSKKRKNSSAARRRAMMFRNRIIAILAVFLLFLFSAYLILNFSHPVGVFEYLKYSVLSAGSGEGYNINIEGGKPIYTVSDGKVYYVVTDSTVNCYNTSGKVIFEQPHSFGNPVIKKSETRYLLYDQGEPELSVCTLSGGLYSHVFDHGIICADISNSGYFAVATKVEGYDSSVSVFNKKNEKVFEWFSSNETVNAVSLSENGKTVSVATVKVESGNFVSNVYVFKYKSATPVMQKTYSDQVVYQLLENDNRGFFAVFANKVEFLNPKKGSTVTHESEYSVSLVKQYGNRTIVVRTVAANQDNSVIEILNKKGEIVSSFEVDTHAIDIAYKSGKIYLLGRTGVYKYNVKGKLLSVAETNYDTLFIEVISDNSVACIRSSIIEKTNLSKVEK